MGLMNLLGEIKDSVDEYGAAVGWGMGTVQLGMRGMVWTGIARAGARAGNATWRQVSAVTKEGYTRLNVPQRAVRAAAATGSEMGYAAMDVVMPGVQDMARGMQWRVAEGRGRGNWAVGRDFGVEGMAG